MAIETIVAQCTPSGSGAIALLRISGPDAWGIVSKCAHLSSKRALASVQSHTIHHGKITSSLNKTIDDVLFFAMRGPRSFTGEDVIEVTCHNNPFIIEEILERIIECGARLAQAGEFSRQAVENNKLDLTQAEAINELIHANSQQLLKQSLEQLDGSLSHWINLLEKQIIQLMALCEASFEFLEEEMDFSKQMDQTVTQVLEKIASLKKTFDQQQQLREGMRIAIIGSVNAGKSSLFNTLIGKKRAIVTNIAGTTRDVIEAGMYDDGVYVTLVDTAGLRKTDDIIEKEGIERSYKEAKLADIVLLTFNGSAFFTKNEKSVYQQLLKTYQEKTILVQNKTDLENKKEALGKVAIKISTKTGTGIEQLKKLIAEKIKAIFTSGGSSFLLNKRQFRLLCSFEQELFTVKKMLQNNPDYELISHHLRDGLAHLNELTGKTVTEKALDAVFKEFCVGK